jgi:hypothetical protein
MGRAIPPEWTVNLLALGKEPWIFKDLEDQMNMYRQQWQADQQKQIVSKMAGKMPGKIKWRKKKKNLEEIITIQVADAVVLAKTIITEEDAEEAREDAAEEETTIVSIRKMLNVSIVAKRATILLTAQYQEKWQWTVKHGIQVGFQNPISIFIERNAYQKGQTSKE